ncbi:hypothetical protein AAFF_G00415820 [Aldrovandia affinis]|uniref:Uncharacterized protein n=1 Tax=Aldrovandia affinis TaxID=143900 RepID=A0AAD7SBA4_9TELE|nr:hypothetical protein AAFF_G00415820 [Aldrovandia affinis]
MAFLTGEISSSFEEWDFFSEDDGWNDHHRSPSPELTETHLETSELSAWANEKIESSSPWQVFRDGFPMVDTFKDATISEIKPLLQLLQKTSEQPPPSSSPVLCDAASLWSCLLKEPSGLRLSETNPCPHSLTGLLTALNITPENLCSFQDSPPAEPDREGPSGEPAGPPAGPLIRTKLLASDLCRDAPSFLYQISCQWLSKHNLHLQRPES